MRFSPGDGKEHWDESMVYLAQICAKWSGVMVAEEKREERAKGRKALQGPLPQHDRCPAGQLTSTSSHKDMSTGDLAHAFLVNIVG